MTAFPGTPRLTRGGLVLLDPATGAVTRVVAFQYNPDTLTRTLEPQGAGDQAGDQAGDRLEALRLTGPPRETVRLEAELDATEALETPERFADVAEHGLLPALAALETIVSPSAAAVRAAHAQADAGILEIAPVEAPLSLFVWGRGRVLPVRITELGVTEEGFDTGLNPIRARVTLGLRVLSLDDLPAAHRGGALWLLAQQQKERLAAGVRGVSLGALGLTGIPGV
ncbi:hypothetical protein [Actinomycetospora cinnamomea]|uniref:Uncharacterized protein n=1 Tax=Actinomycetospora cinnamomea TaxID=663609 RepID=A0A2U1F7Q3_9PSEU|nr:hypothetical protein [Actinomycetospora cinnamomea]PVZ08198.1 hypothetical protein C8D89_10981 [Actinomycetospora cinnamomea]